MKLRFIFPFIINLISVTAVFADSSNYNNLLVLLDKKSSNEQMRLSAIEAGAKRVFVCKYCHGADGNSRREHIPNLAQQNTKYLLAQFELFATKARKNQVMNDLSMNLSNDDRVNIALYYASRKVKSREAFKPELAKHGKHLFDTVCSNCHGVKGHGHDELPHIAGQPPVYIIKSLNKYKSGSTSRPNSVMNAISKDLSTDDVSALAAYLSVLK